jgi:hypothetical protein
MSSENDNLGPLPDFPPTDPTGDIDLSLIDHNLSLSPAERIRQHDRALAMVEAFREAGRRQRLAMEATRGGGDPEQPFT